MDAMKTFGVYDGEYFSFIKGSFNKAETRAADAAARVFELDPLILYSKESLLEALREEMDKLAEIRNSDNALESLKEALAH